MYSANHDDPPTLISWSLETVDFAVLAYFFYFFQIRQFALFYCTSVLLLLLTETHGTA